MVRIKSRVASTPEQKREYLSDQSIDNESLRIFFRCLAAAQAIDTAGIHRQRAVLRLGPDSRAMRMTGCWH